MKNVRVKSLTGSSIKDHHKMALKVVDALYDTIEEEIQLDLSNVEWFTPAFLTPLSVAYRRLTDMGTNIDIQLPLNAGIQAYTRQIGFPEGAKEPSEQYDNHLPLCLLNANSDRDTIDIMGDKLRELMKQHFDSLPADHVNGIYYPVSEIIANVDQHSHCDFGAALVQYYPTKEYLDICIVDDGVSIPGNFDDNSITYDDDNHATRLAINGEVSTRSGEGYRDRGYGLKTTSELVCNGLNGELLLSSRNGVAYRNGDSISHPTTSDLQWNGTIFIARLELPSEGFRLLDYITP